MKKIIIAIALLAVAGSQVPSAKAGVSFFGRFGFGSVAVSVPTPVVCATAPVYVAPPCYVPPAPVVCAPAPVVVYPRPFVRHEHVVVRHDFDRHEHERHGGRW